MMRIVGTLLDITILFPIYSDSKGDDNYLRSCASILYCCVLKAKIPHPLKFLDQQWWFIGDSTAPARPLFKIIISFKIRPHLWFRPLGCWPVKATLHYVPRLAILFTLRCTSPGSRLSPITSKPRQRSLFSRGNLQKKRRKKKERKKRCQCLDRSISFGFLRWGG